MDNISVGTMCCGGATRFHPQLLPRLGMTNNPEQCLAFDYFMDDFGQSLHGRPINKDCILINPEACGLLTNYKDLKWNVTNGHFFLHQSVDIQEGLCGLEDINYASFDSQQSDGTILIDAWFGGIGSWVSVTMRNVEARYIVVDNGTYEWEKKITLELYHNDGLLWKSDSTKSTNILNSFPLGISTYGPVGRISNTDDNQPVFQMTNTDLEQLGPIKIGSSYSYTDNQFTGIAGVYWFGHRRVGALRL